jgi:hypothetical protein
MLRDLAHNERDVIAFAGKDRGVSKSKLFGRSVEARLEGDPGLRHGSRRAYPGCPAMAPGLFALHGLQAQTLRGASGSYSALASSTPTATARLGLKRWF